jgi:hypothetical protein
MAVPLSGYCASTVAGAAYGVRVIGGVSDLIGLLTPYDTQRAFLRHALSFSPCLGVQWAMAITHQTSERAAVAAPTPTTALAASGGDARAGLVWQVTCIKARSTVGEVYRGERLRRARVALRERYPSLPCRLG